MMTIEYIQCAWGVKAPINTVLQLYALKSEEFRFALQVASMERLENILAAVLDPALGKHRRKLIENRLAYLKKVNAELGATRP